MQSARGETDRNGNGKERNRKERSEAEKNGTETEGNGAGRERTAKGRKENVIRRQRPTCDLVGILIRRACGPLARVKSGQTVSKGSGYPFYTPRCSNLELNGCSNHRGAPLLSVPARFRIRSN